MRTATALLFPLLLGCASSTPVRVTGLPHLVPTKLVLGRFDSADQDTRETVMFRAEVVRFLRSRCGYTIIDEGGTQDRVLTGAVGLWSRGQGGLPMASSTRASGSVRVSTAEGSLLWAASTDYTEGDGFWRAGMLASEPGTIVPPLVSKLLGDLPGCRGS